MTTNDKTFHSTAGLSTASQSKAWRAAAALAGCLAAAPAHAVDYAVDGTAPVAAAAVDIAQGSETRQFDIPAQPLAQALLAFKEQSGLQLAYKTEAVSGLTTQGVDGSLTQAEALGRLLAGTGLVYEFTAAKTVTLSRPQAGDRVTLGTVSVEGRRPAADGALIGNLPPAYAGGQVARGGQVGLLGNRDIMDTPFSQTSYTQQTIEDQQARSVVDVVANDPSVRPTWPGAGYSAPLMIRGFQASNQDVSFNGLYGVAPFFTVGMDMAERVEVFKGPTGLLTGMQPLGSVGGGVNIVPKRAGDEPLTRVAGTYANDKQFGGKADVGRRFGANKEYGIRLNGGLEDGDTAVEHQSRTFGTALAALDYRGERLRLSADMGHQLHNMNAPTLITFVNSSVAVPDAPDASSNWFFPWSWNDISDTFGAARAEFDITPDWTVHAAIGGRYTEWERLTYFPNITNAAGDLTATPGHLHYKYYTNSEDVGLRGKFNTGALAHQVSLGVMRYHQTTNSRSESATGGAIASNLYNPSNAGAPGISKLTLLTTSEAELTSLAIGDVLSLYDDRLQLILGARQQKIDVRNYSSTTGAPTSTYEKSALTPAVGFVAKPWQNVSVYGNYIEGLQQGTIVGSTYANAGEILAPYISKQMEVGVKADWGSIGGAISVFQITQPSGTAPSSTGTFSTDGEQRNRGVELTTFGKLRDDLRVLGGVTFTDAVLTATANGTNDGNRAPGVPKVQVNLGMEWDTPFVPGLSLLGRVIYTGEQQVDNGNTQEIPDWARFDLGVRYRIDRKDGNPVVFRLNVDNVLDNDYWASAGYYPGWLSPGAPRTVMLSLTTDF